MRIVQPGICDPRAVQQRWRATNVRLVFVSLGCLIFCPEQVAACFIDVGVVDGEGIVERDVFGR